METCSICRSIPFHRLPAEEEAGLAHQPSVRALRAEAASCSLCALLVSAVEELLGRLRKEAEVEVEASSSRVVVPAGGGGDAAGGDAAGAGAAGAGAGGCLQASGPDRNGPGMPRPVADLGTTLLPLLEEAAVRGEYGPSSAAADEGVDSLAEPLQQTSVADGVVRPWLYGNWWIVRPKDREHPQLVGLGVRLGTGPGVEQALGNTRGTVHQRGSSLRIRTDDDSPMSAFIPGRLRTAQACSALGLERVKSWVRKCDWTHICAPLDSVLPTRLLDVGQDADSDEVVLRETAGRKGRYIALSHCWGASRRITTTTGTLEEHKKGIALADLPKTYQDAVFIARQLRVRYLWIDALCIVQDDLSDWEQEASRMADVYASAYLTIAASSATDDCGGCFPSEQMRQNANHVSPEATSMGHAHVVNAAALTSQLDSGEMEFVAQKPFATLLASLEDGRSSRLYFSMEWMPPSSQQEPKHLPIGTYGAALDPVSHEPLNQRAWALQERLLSPRVLHFGLAQMYWECQQSLVGEDGSSFQNIFFTLEGIIAGQAPLPTPASAPEPTPPELSAQRAQQRTLRRSGWLALIQNYSRRALAHGADKLPALSGLTHRIAAATHDRCVAGLWRHHVWEDLYWTVHGRRQYPPTSSSSPLPVSAPQVGARRPSETYRAPSWSWASTDSSIIFPPVNWDVDGIVAEFLDWDVTLAGSDPHGRLTAGWIKILAPLHEIRPSDSDVPQLRPETSAPVTVTVTIAKGRSTGIAHFDAHPLFPAYALFLTPHHALLLQKSPTPAPAPDHTYLRIGTAWFRSMAEDAAVEQAGAVPLDVEGSAAESEARVVVRII